MTRVTLQEAEGNLARLIEELDNGADVVIARQDKPDVRLVTLETEQPRPKRVPGRLKGLIDIGPEFFEPLPEDELRAWEGRGDWDFSSTPQR